MSEAASDTWRRSGVYPSPFAGEVQQVGAYRQDLARGQARFGAQEQLSDLVRELCSGEDVTHRIFVC